MQGARGEGAVPSREMAWHLPCNPWRPEGRMDLVFVIATVAFFAVSLAYVSGCDRL
jgi:hypothetical protein